MCCIPIWLIANYVVQPETLKHETWSSRLPKWLRKCIKWRKNNNSIKKSKKEIRKLRWRKNATKTHKFCKNFMNEIIQAAGRRCLCTNKEATHANRLARKSCFRWRLIYYIDCWMTPIHARLFHLLFIFFLLSNVYLMEWDGVGTGWWWVGSAFSSWDEL